MYKDIIFRGFFLSSSFTLSSDAHHSTMEVIGTLIFFFFKDYGVARVSTLGAFSPRKKNLVCNLGEEREI